MIWQRECFDLIRQSPLQMKLQRGWRPLTWSGKPRNCLLLPTPTPAHVSCSLPDTPGFSRLGWRNPSIMTGREYKPWVMCGEEVALGSGFSNPRAMKGVGVPE